MELPKGEFLHPFFDMEAEKDNLASTSAGDQSYGAISNGLVASYETQITQKQAVVHLAELIPRVYAAKNSEMIYWRALHKNWRLLIALVI